MRLVLHIGSTKTGTTAVQKYLSEHRDALLEQGVYYPEFGCRAGAHHILASCHHPTAKGLHKAEFQSIKWTPGEHFKNLSDRIVEHAYSLSCDKILISSEYLWGVFDDEFYRHWSHQFDGLEKTIAALIRRPDDWLQSTYIQTIKRGENRSFDQWLEAYSAKPAAGVDFYGVLSGWSSGFDDSEIIIDDYDALLKGPSFIRGFVSNFLGIDVQQLPHPTVLANRSPSKRYLELIIALNRSSIPKKDRADIRAVLLNKGEKREIGEELDLISDEKRRQILKSYEPQIAKIQEEFGIDAKDGLFTKPWPAAD